MGIDQVSITMIEANPRKYLYPLWNRLASGSYIPPAVREATIPKGVGKERILGIPTVMNYSAASYGVSENKSNCFALCKTV